MSWSTQFIIYINFVEFEYIMLHVAKFQDHRTISSGKKILKVLPYMGMAAILNK